MRFAISQPIIRDVLSKVQGLTGRKSNLGIYETVLIEASESSVRISATDQETSFTGLYPAHVEAEGKIAINAKKFFEIVRDYPLDEVLINAIERNWIEIGSQNIEYHIVGMDPEQFQDLPQIEDVPLIKLESITFRRMLERMVVIAAAPEERRAHITGVLLETVSNDDEKVLKLVSTDGSRLSKVDYRYDPAHDLPDGIRLLIPKKGLNEVIKFLGPEGDVSIGSTANQLVLKKDAEILIMRLLEGDFPEYSGVLIKEGVSSVNVNKAKFQKVLKRMSILTSDNYKGVAFNFDQGKLIITATNPDMGESKEDLTIEYDGPLIEIGFNPRYFIETLDRIDGDQVFIHMKGDESPCLIEGENNSNYITAIMPMKI